MLIESAIHFTPDILSRPRPGPLAVVATLEHFSIITYAVDPDALSRHLAPRFDPVCVRLGDGRVRALVSVVSLHNVDFRFIRFPLIRGSFGQINYRAYVQDRETGSLGVWFFGTCLDSISVVVPHYLWKLPWHRGRVSFGYDFDGANYRVYRMHTDCEWAPANVELRGTGAPADSFEGFPDRETAMRVLAHPLDGYYLRSDGRVGSIQVWHQPLTPHAGVCRNAWFALLDRLDLVPLAEQSRPYNVMLQRRIEFTTYLPPRTLAES